MLGLSHLYLQFVKQKRFFQPCFPSTSSALAGYFPKGTYLQVMFLSKEFKVFLSKKIKVFLSREFKVFLSKEFKVFLSKEFKVFLQTLPETQKN